MMRSIVATALVVSALVGACSAAPVQPPPIPSMAPRPTDAPPVTRTLQFSQYQGKVCASLTAEQQASLEVPPQVRQGSLVCEFEKWEPRHVRFTIQFFAESDVLANAYQESNQEQWKQFQPATIAGQPAVIHSFGLPGQNLTCEVVVGTGPNQGAAINASGMDNTVNWCDKATRAAEYVVRNLGG
jgi:hypothetical protein